MAEVTLACDENHTIFLQSQAGRYLAAAGPESCDRHLSCDRNHTSVWTVSLGVLQRSRRIMGRTAKGWRESPRFGVTWITKPS